MAKQPPTAPGFAIPPGQHGQHGYPPIQQQPGYPAYPAAAYPQQPYPQQPYPQQPYPQQSYPQQPFITPGQGYSQQWINPNFQTYLAGATAFNVVQKVELLEALVGWETSNKYTVKDQAGNKIFYVGEETAVCQQLCCGKYRSFNIVVKDTTGQTIMTFSRDLDCGWFFCGYICPDEVKVTTPSSQLLGSIEEVGSCFYPRFIVKSATGQPLYNVVGPMCACGLVTFEVTDMNDQVVGTIKKEWGGIVRELFTDADSFSVSFPQHADPMAKAALLGALFMIDFHYFEKSSGGGQGARRLFS